MLDFSLAENSVLHDYDEPPISRSSWLDRDAMVSARRRVDRALRRARRRPARRPRARSRAATSRRSCSRARSSPNPRLLLAAQPTRGLDVGAIEFVHRRLVEQRDAGCAVLLVSFELDEVLDLADRILVMYGGQIVLERLSGQTDERELGLAMTGGAVPA